MNPTRTITIVVRAHNNFDVHEGECYTNRLCWDEMLAEIASLTHPAIKASRYGMHLPEFYQEREERFRAMREVAMPTNPRTELEALERFVEDWGSRAGPEDALLPPQQQSSVIRSAMEVLAAARRNGPSTNPTSEKP